MYIVIESDLLRHFLDQSSQLSLIFDIHNCQPIGGFFECQRYTAGYVEHVVFDVDLVGREPEDRISIGAVGTIFRRGR